MFTRGVGPDAHAEKLGFVEKREGVFRLRARDFCRGTKVPKSPPGLRPRPPWGAIRQMERNLFGAGGGCKEDDLKCCPS